MTMTVNTCNRGRENYELHGPGSTPADKGIPSQVLRTRCAMVRSTVRRVVTAHWQQLASIISGRIQQVNVLVDLAHYLTKKYSDARYSL